MEFSKIRYLDIIISEIMNQIRNTYSKSSSNSMIISNISYILESGLYDLTNLTVTISK